METGSRWSNSWLGSVMTLAIPVTSTLMAWAFLGDQGSLWQFVGMTVVMFALAAVVLDQSRTKLT